MTYENISGLVDLESESKYKIAIVGESGVGKSWLAFTAPGSIYECDFDTRAESFKEYVRVSKRTDMVAKTYTDIIPGSPQAVAQFETDISMFEYLKQQGKAIPEWYILDSMSYLRAACEHELIKQHPSMARKVRLGVNTLNIPSHYDIVNGNRNYMEYIIGRVSELGNVIAIFHEMDEKDTPASTKEVKAYTGRKTIQPQYLASLLSLFNDRFRVTIDYSGNRIVQTQPSSDFLAVTSMKLDATEKPNLSDMIKKHQERTK